MSIWHVSIVRILRESGLFTDVQLAGGKVRAIFRGDVEKEIHEVIEIVRQRTSGGE